MVNNMLSRNMISAVVAMVILLGNCSRKQESVTTTPSQTLPVTGTAAVAEPPEGAPPYTGQSLLFVNKDEASLYSKPSESSFVCVRLKRDALVVLIEKNEAFVKVYAPVTGDVGYIKERDLTDSIQTSTQYQARCSELENRAKMKLMKEYDRFPSIEALEKYYLYPFISSDDMKKMLSVYKGDIGNYVCIGQSFSWELKPDSLPNAIVNKLRSDSLKVSMFSSGSKPVLLAGEPFLEPQNEYDDEGVIKKTSGNAVRTIKSRLFEESVRLIRLTRETGTGPIIVTHGPPHSQCHQCETLVSLFGVGEFVHTYEKRVPVRLLLKTGFAEGYITRIVHSTFEVSPCYQDGGKGLFFIETSVPENEKVFGVLLGIENNVSPVVKVRNNGDWIADLNNDGIADLKCLFVKNQDYEELLSSYYFVNIEGKWVLTDMRYEPECT